MSSAFKEAKNLLDIGEVAAWLGLEIKRGYISCPFHRERTPSCKLYEHTFFCFGCGKSGDSISLVAQAKGATQFEALKELNQAFSLGLEIGGKSAGLKKKQSTTFDYKKWKDSACDLLSWWCRHFFGIGFESELLQAEELHDRLICSTPEQGYILYAQEVERYERAKRRFDELSV